MKLITAEVRWISGSRNNAISNGDGSVVSTQKRTDFSDNSHGVAAVCCASDCAELDSPLLRVIADTGCSLLFFNSNFISPEF